DPPSVELTHPLRGYFLANGGCQVLDWEMYQGLDSPRSPRLRPSNETFDETYARKAARAIKPRASRGRYGRIPEQHIPYDASSAAPSSHLRPAGEPARAGTDERHATAPGGASPGLAVTCTGIRRPENLARAGRPR